MSKIRIITDSGCDMNAEMAKKYGISIIPISYTFDGVTYYECGKEQTCEQFFERERREKEPPKTAQITPIQYEEFFSAVLGEGYDTLIYISISANASGMYQNACMVAREMSEEGKGKIYVVDGKSFTMSYGLPALMAAKMAAEGADAETILKKLDEALSGANVYFLVGDLTHLKKGGRINTATLLVANMLDIRPVLTVKNGLIEQVGKIRGEKKLFKKLLDIVEDEHGLKGRYNYYIAHSCVSSKAAELREEVLARIGDTDIEEVPIGPIIGTHAGPDVCAIGFFDTEINYK
ncbi:MAG: DegV family protein [Clostridia bacterium]|nr:DegV family protein [Clostridia bacterium]